jgi:copper chaperone CopZ
MDSSDPRARTLAPLAIALAVVVIALALAFAGVFSQQKASRTTSTEEAHMNTVVLPVEGMACVACVARVRRSLTSIDGVGDVQVSLGERNARVRFDPNRLDPNELVAAINNLDYKAGTPVEAR